MRINAKTFLTMLGILGVFVLQAQKESIPMTPDFWEYDSTTTEFVIHRNVRAVKGKVGKFFQIFLKDQVFKNGTIEFDVELIGTGFPGINFRMSEDRKNGENFYIRSFGDVAPEVRTTLQYAAITDGMSLWDLTDEYQSGSTIYQEGWNHVKLVVSGLQMLVYVNDMSQPSLRVPCLEGWTKSGGISLNGNVIYANLVITEGQIEGLDPSKGFDQTTNDTRYIKNWQVSSAIDFPFGREVKMQLPSMFGGAMESDLPDSTTLWTPLKSETRALINLSRKFGLSEQGDRRLAWLKTTINSDKVQDRILHLGFSDEVWVFGNDQLIYVDKNYFGTPSQKGPKGRCTIENSSFKLPLLEGENEIMIGLANYFYGWGIIARLDDTQGLK